jgi:hypothetical protein
LVFVVPRVTVPTTAGMAWILAAFNQYPNSVEWMACPRLTP